MKVTERPDFKKETQQIRKARKNIGTGAVTITTRSSMLGNSQKPEKKGKMDRKGGEDREGRRINTTGAPVSRRAEGGAPHHDP